MTLQRGVAASALAAYLTRHARALQRDGLHRYEIAQGVAMGRDRPGVGCHRGQRIEVLAESLFLVKQRQPPGVRARILRQFADALEALGETSAGLQLMREAFEMIRPGDV